MVATPLFDWAIRATLMLAIALPLVELLGRRSATSAHRLLATVMLSLLVVLPTGMMFAPGWQWALPFWKSGALSESAVVPEPQALPVAFEGGLSDANIGSKAQSPVAIDEAPKHGPPLDVELAQPESSGSAVKNTPVASAPSTTLAASQDPADGSAIEARLMDWPQAVVSIWIVVAALLALRRVQLFRRLGHFVSGCEVASPALANEVVDTARSCGVTRPPRLQLAEPGSMPMACWLGRWVIVAPRDIESWPAKLRRVALLHELGHIARRDAWTDHLAQCVVCVLWPIPLTWFAVAQTLRLRERACDEWSLPRFGGGARQYAESLIEIVRRSQQPPHRAACAIADQHGFETRVKRLFACTESRKRWAAVGVPAAVVALGLAVVVATAGPTNASAQEDAQRSTPETPQVLLSSEPSPDEPSLSVRGTVRDLAGAPVADATVVLRANLGGVQYVGGLQHARDVLARTTTDAQGEYSFSSVGFPPRCVRNIDNLRKGKVGAHVLAWAEGAGLQWKPVTSFYSADIDFRLEEEAEVSGLIVDENGKPVGDGELSAFGFTRGIHDLSAYFDDPGDLSTIRSEVRFVAPISDARFALAHM
ncbi:MAG: M56 family metallopeptidase, partial [Planctomycetota bacterium]